MRKFIPAVLAISLFFACNNEKTETGQGINAPDKPSPDTSMLFAYKASLEAFSRADVEGFIANYDDNVIYIWASNDSIKGKDAVRKYYAGRWDLIDSVLFSDYSIIPVEITAEQASAFKPAGKWILSWNKVYVKYKNGKHLNFWVHRGNHINSAGKIDIATEFLDRRPIVEATKDMVK